MATSPAADKPAPPHSTTQPAAPKNAAGKAAPDWERIELDYRAGIKSLRQIADDYGISEGAVRKRAKRDDWTRDLSGRIQDKAEQLVRKEAVRSLVRTDGAITERVLVEANAKAAADIRLSHRRDIARAKGVANGLLDELEDGAQMYELDARVKMAKTLADTLRITVDMERQAFGMDAKGADTTPGSAGYVPPSVQIIHVAAPRREDDEE